MVVKSHGRRSLKYVLFFRVGILIQSFNNTTKSIFSLPLVPSSSDHFDALPALPSIIRQELEASEINKGLRVMKLIALHPSSSVELPLVEGGIVLALGAPQKVIHNNKAACSEDISSVDISESGIQNDGAQSVSDESNDTEDCRKRQEILSSCVGRTTDIPAPVKQFLIELRQVVPVSIEKPLTASISALLHAYQSFNPHISRAASHALGVVMRHEAQRRREALEKVKHSKIFSQSPSFSIPISDIFHHIIISNSLTETFTSVALTHCRSPLHLQVATFGFLRTDRLLDSNMMQITSSLS